MRDHDARILDRAGNGVVVSGSEQTEESVPRRSRRRFLGRPAAGLAAGLAVLALIGGYLALDAADVVPGPFTTRAAPTAPPAPTETPAPGATLVPAPVTLPGVDPDAPLPNGDVLLARMRPALDRPELAAGTSVSVVDTLTGAAVVSVGADTPRTPASTTKLLTAAAVLTTLDPQSRLVTRAVAGTTPDEVVLVGGGDVLLAAGAPGEVVGAASLATLAARTAANLAARGQDGVTVRVDDSLFSGPAVPPSWQPGDVSGGYAAPVTALAVNAGRIGTEPYAPRHRDPSIAAGEDFARALAAEGVTVVPGVARTRAPAEADELAQVSSATIADQVAHMTLSSDNTLAEALGRLVALELGRPGSVTDAAAAVVERVSALGVDTTGVVLTDTSGLGDGSAVPAGALTSLLHQAVTGEDPALGGLAAVLPVAGLSGTLTDRFSAASADPATGLVRAKTGSLTGTTTLAGVVTDADGRSLAFAVLADAVPAGATSGARAAVDDLAAQIAACGCT